MRRCGLSVVTRGGSAFWWRPIPSSWVRMCVAEAPLSALTANARRCASSSAASGNPLPHLKTASLGDTANLGDLPDLGEVKTEAAMRATFADVAGPWIVLAGPLQGELLVDAEGYCFFRPGDSLGHGVGAVQLRETPAGVAVVIQLEVYRYQQQARDPPAEPERFAVAAVLSRASSVSQNYSTLTLNGHLRSGSQQSEHLGTFNAAKMEPWSADQQPTYSPNSELSRAFDQIFAERLNLSRFQRAPLDLSKYKVSNVEKVYYVPNYFSEVEEATCIRLMNSTPSELKKKLDRRVVQEYGGIMCPECNMSFINDETQPPWTARICDALVHDRIFTPATFPNNVRIHEYEVGHGIAPHQDGPIYVPKVAIVSLLSSVVMGFYPHRKPYDDAMEHYNDTFKFDGDITRQRPEFSLVLEPRSLLVFESDAYYFHPHGISANAVDSLAEDAAGPIANRHLLTQTPPTATEIVRQKRIGVTIRNLLSRCNHQPERAEYTMKRVWKLGHPDFLPLQAAGGTSTMYPAKPASVAAASAPPPKPSDSWRAAEQRNVTSAATVAPSAASDPVRSSPAPNGVDAASITELHRKLDEVLQNQRDLQQAVKQLQVLTAHSIGQGSTFQTEVSGVLDHLTAAVMDIQAQTDKQE